MPVLYKGAGPGSYWQLNDPLLHGFGLVPSRTHSPATMVTHITSAAASSSPYLSFTASFAVAMLYASQGPGGRASAATPGFIYEIAASGLTLYDPVREIAGASTFSAGHLPLPTHHDGAQDLILGVAGSPWHTSCLTSAPARSPGSPAHPPVITRNFNATVYALRDAEVLVQAPVPRSCVVAVYRVA